MIRTLIAVTVMVGIAALGARPAAADDPHERPCQAPIEAGVRAALPASTHIVCPVYSPEVQIVNGTAVADKDKAVRAEVVLADGRMATVELSPDGRVLGMTYAHSDLVGSSGKGWR